MACLVSVRIQASAIIAGFLLLSVGLAGGAGGAAGRLGFGDRHLLHVVVGHETDEDAVRLVIPGHAWDHGDPGGGWLRGGCALGAGRVAPRRLVLGRGVCLGAGTGWHGRRRCRELAGRLTVGVRVRAVSRFSLGGILLAGTVVVSAVGVGTGVGTGVIGTVL